MKDKIERLLQLSEKMIIPAYQREFVWNHIEGEEFLEDVISSADPLFLGTFIFNREHKGTIEIVDGQQRITTILVFLIACRVVAREKQLSDPFQAMLQSWITLQSIDRVDEEPTARLESGGKIGQALKVMSSSAWDGRYDRASMGSRHGWNRINKAYGLFHEKLQERKYDQDRLTTLIKKVLSIEYIEIGVRDKSEAISTFERVNARGQHLAVYDLVKAFLFSAELAANNLDINIEDEWEKIKDHADQNDNKLKKILHAFYSSQKGYIPQSELYRRLKRIATPDIETFINELKLFARFYSIVNSKTENFTEKITSYLTSSANEDGLGLPTARMDDQGRMNNISKSLFAISLFKAERVYPLIYASLRALARIVPNAAKGGTKEIKAWILLLQFVEDFCFINTCITNEANQHSGVLQRVYGDYCRKFCDGSSDFVQTTQELKESIRAVITVPEGLFVDKFTELTYQDKNDEDIMYYIFGRLHRSQEAEEVDSVDEDATVKDADIFMPEQYNDADRYVEYILPSSQDTRESVFSIGNLVVVNSRNRTGLNPDAEPSKRIKQLERWLDNRAIINRSFTRNFIRYFKKACFAETRRTWDEDLIEERSKDLGKEIYQIAYYN